MSARLRLMLLLALAAFLTSCIHPRTVYDVCSRISRIRMDLKYRRADAIDSAVQKGEIAKE